MLWGFLIVPVLQPEKQSQDFALRKITRQGQRPQDLIPLPRKGKLSAQGLSGKHITLYDCRQENLEAEPQPTTI